MSTFISLLGDSYAGVVVLMDATPKTTRRIESLNQKGSGGRRGPIKWVEVTRVRDADIEDLFEPNFYLRLVNDAYADELPTKLTLKTISDSNPRIAQRIAAHFASEGICGGKFDTYRPAAYLLQTFAARRNEIDDDTIERAASMFDRINALLPSNGASNGVSAGADRTLVTAR